MSDTLHDTRFLGIDRLYGTALRDLLVHTHVVVAGLGGVGSWAAEALARSGVGEISLIDLDEVCTSNINRQLVALDSTVGRLKVEVMAERIRQINPDCQVHAIADFLTTRNLDTRVPAENGPTYVLDCIDSVKIKAALIAHCKRHKIPIITTGAAGGKSDPTQIRVVDLNRTYNDPLAAKVRSLLRSRHGFSRNPKRHYSVPCVFSTEQQVYPKPDGSVCQAKSFHDGSTRLDCASGFGASTMVTASFGFTAVAHLLKKLGERV